MTSTLVREPTELHECDVPAPTLRAGAVVRCDECGRRWKLALAGFTFKDWRRTFPTFLADLIRGRSTHRNWAGVERGPQDKRRFNPFSR